jgi:hypothetical protein
LSGIAERSISPTFTLVRGAVTELRYSGDDDEAVGPDGVGAPIVRERLKHPDHYVPVATPFYAPTQPYMQSAPARSAQKSDAK